jgi:hypothetical protein
MLELPEILISTIVSGLPANIGSILSCIHGPDQAEPHFRAPETATSAIEEA